MVAAQNNAGTAPAKIGRPWQKGHSGNPGGRPKIAADVKAEARKHTKEALGRLVHWMRSDDPQASIRASTAILDRGCGKPEQAVAKWGSEDFRNKPIVIAVNPFRGHLELMAERQRQEQAAIPADTQAAATDGD